MADPGERERFTLRRWSQRKLAAAREPTAPPESPPPAAVAVAPGSAATAPKPGDPPAQPALPPVESLTFDADFSAFMKPEVDPSLQRAALKKLFTDPRFNVMDGLDVYIDDYSKPDPIDAETVRGLVQARYIFDPPKTRVNAQGEVEDVPPEEEDEKAAAEADASAVPSDPPPGNAPALDDIQSASTAGIAMPEAPEAAPAEPTSIPGNPR
ncbi:MAG: DUF3306 domain-containing protein [Betaproteobacteria bacterium]